MRIQGKRSKAKGTGEGKRWEWGRARVIYLTMSVLEHLLQAPGNWTGQIGQFWSYKSKIKDQSDSSILLLTQLLRVQ